MPARRPALSGSFLVSSALFLAIVICSPVRLPADEPVSEDQLQFFETRIRPVLVKHCSECHFGTAVNVKGGLLLDSRDRARRGGDTGPAVVPGKPEDSPLIRALRYEGPKMPPAGQLPEDTIADFVRWIESGAADPRDRPPEGTVTGLEAARDHWAFRPVEEVILPAVRHVDRVSQPIDQFLLARMEAAGVEPVAVADRRTLLRRLTYDLTGLPPSPAEVSAFLADESDESWQRLVDRLLESPQYGARWGRMWLDVVRYADTAGETADFPAPHAWRYRNYVINAFNANKPYDTFLREQLAGDILARSAAPEQFAELNTATGYLAIARRFGFDASKDHYLTIEDTIDTLGKSVLGLTIGCARCHNHKYDPISSVDYYGLYGIFESTKYSFPGCEKEKRPRDMVPLLHPSVYEQTQAPLKQELAEVEAALAAANAEQGKLNQALREQTEGKLQELARGLIDDGGAQLIGEPAVEVDVAAGQLLLLKIDRRDNYGADTTQVEWEITEAGGQNRVWNLARDVVADFLAGNPHADSLGNPAVWSFFDLRGGVQLLGEAARGLSGHPGLAAWRRGDNPSVFVNGTGETAAVWTKLAAKSVFVHPAADGPVGIGWIAQMAGRVRVRGKITDAHPGGPDGVSWEVFRVAADIGSTLGASSDLARRVGGLTQRRGELTAQMAKVAVAYGVTEGTPHNARLQRRGEPADLGDEVPRKFLDVLGGQRLETGETGSGRLELAAWLTDPANPLTARVFVNRVWQQHFGRPLVATPSDFGTRGAVPTHPELLDWLAGWFVKSGWNVKALHRLIVTSAMYRLQSVTGPVPGSESGWKLDPANALYWRFERRRLSAEEIRDSLLSASGRLDLSPGEAHPFPPEESWGFTQHGPFNAVYDSDRRSVYLMVQRIRRHPFLGLFDGADPSASTAVRPVSTVATQALFFLNSPFLHEQATHLTDRLFREASDDVARMELACLLLYGRRATLDDRLEFEQFVREYQASLTDVAAAEQARETWCAWCRVLLSSNEFLYVD